MDDREGRAEEVALAAGPRKWRFHAFLSYSTDPDYRLARMIERHVEAFHRRRIARDLPKLEVCRDGSDFHVPKFGSAANEQQIQSILQEHLDQSAYLAVLCSSGAVRSPHVRTEIEYILAQGRADDVLLLITEGAEPALQPESVFPEPILRAGLHRRIYYDLRGKRHRRNRHWRGVRDFQDELTRFTADLYGRSAGDLYPTWQRQRLFRKRALVTAAVAAGLMLAALAGYWAWSRTNAFQLRVITVDSASIVPAVNENAAYDWVELLARTGRNNAAEAQASSIHDPEYRAKALAFAALGVAAAPRTDKAFVTRLTMESQRLADGIPDPYGRAETFIVISDALVRIGQFDGARAAFDRAFASALKVEPPVLKMESLLTLSGARYYRHDPAAAAQLARLLDELSKAESDQQQRALELARVATLTFLARAADAQDRASAALEAARGIPSMRTRADTLAAVAEQFADSGMDWAARRAAADSLTVAQSIKGSLRIFVLTNQVFPVLKRLGDRMAIIRGLAMVRSELAAETDPDSKVRSIGELLPWVGEFSSRGEAELLLRDAITASKQIDDPDRSIDVMAQLSHQASKAKLPAAEQMLKTVMEMIPRHTDDRGRSVAYAQAAAGWAELGDFRTARLTGLKCERSDDRLSAYESILRKTA